MTPRPIAAGVFGMARTTARARGRRAFRLAMVLPARIDRTSVPSPASAAIRGAASSSDCGLIASASRSGGGVSPGLTATPRAASAATASDGLGSMIVSDEGGSPPSSQPAAIAPPILPAPIRTRRSGQSLVIAEPFVSHRAELIGRSRVSLSLRGRAAPDKGPRRGPEVARMRENVIFSH